MAISTLKLIPGKLYRIGDRAENCELASDAEISVIIPGGSVLMYVETPVVQPKDHCDCPACRSSTIHHFLFEDRLVMLFDAEDYILPVKTKG